MTITERIAFVKAMRSLNFTSFIDVGSTFESWEDRPLANGGIRVEIDGDVASVWCPAKRYWNAAMLAADVLPVVFGLIGKHVADAVITQGYWSSTFLD